MHELSIAQAVVDIACRHSDGRQITAVEVRVGHLRQVVPTALAFAFDLVAEGTAAEGAELQIVAVPAVGRCPACMSQSELTGFPLLCPHCGADVEVLAGEELLVDAIELEERETSYGH